MKEKILRFFDNSQLTTPSMKITLLIFLLIIAISVRAQDTIQNGNPIPIPEETTDVISPLSRLEFSLSLAVLGFGQIILCIEIFQIRSRQISPEDTIKIFVITIIITAGYSNDQIAPATGLLGTIAGYLLGRIQNKSQQNEENR